MNLRYLQRTAVTAGFGVILLSGTSAFAAGPYHPASSEAGATYHPDHVVSRSRTAVEADLGTAMRHPSWGTAISRGAPWPVARTEQPKTREQVKAELAAAMKNPAWNMVSKGAPWPVVLSDAK